MTKRSLGARALVFPTPILVVGTYDATGQPNAMTASWGGVCATDPPSIAVSLRASTHSHKSILAKRCFTISIPSESHLVETHYVGLVSGREGDKFASLGLTATRGQYVDAPYVEEFSIVFECKLIHTLELGSHTQFVGEVLDVKANDEVLNCHSPDMARIRPLVFDPGLRRYFSIGNPLGDADVLRSTS